jgi:outer membrane protein TolC
MERKLKTILSLLFIFCLTSMNIVLGQKTILSLEQIQTEVQNKYPLVEGKKILSQQSDLSVENIKIAYLPKLYANGKMSYQSDVTKSPLAGPGSFGAPKDQFSINLDVEQLIYNGGRTKSQVKLDKLSTEIEILDLEVKLYELRERVNDAFFSILLLRQSRQVLYEKRKSVNSRLEEVKSAVANGVMAAANSKVLKSELLLIDQQMKELEFAERSSFETLAVLMNRTDDFDIESNVSEEKIGVYSFKQEVSKGRPEYKLFDGKNLLLEEKITLTKKDRLPVISAFGQLGYGQPGYNQLNDEFDSYYLIGAKLSWNIFDWKNSKRNQKRYQLQKDFVKIQESSFQKNQKVELRREHNNISKYNVLLEQDAAIIKLKEEVTKSSSSQLNNGVITSSDYLEDLNKEVQAKLNREYHQIQLNQSLAEYNRILGKTNN